MSGNRDSARWCEVCQTHGDHHTDRHPSDPSATPRVETPTGDWFAYAVNGATQRFYFTSEQSDVAGEIADRLIAAAVREERERLDEHEQIARLVESGALIPVDGDIAIALHRNGLFRIRAKDDDHAL